MNFIKELEWRGMIHDMIPGTEEALQKGMVSGYVGIDPTADSLHIGHLVGIMMLRHLQRSGHRPIALIGGATGMIGDPSGKSKERNLLDEETLKHNQACIKKQLEKFLDFDSDAENAAVLVNNYDWMKDYSFLDFIRDVGKHITVNYMMAKESVRKRLEANAIEGLSFTEFSYQLLQGYDYLHLYQTENVRLQLGGSDQWGNITTGVELIRRVLGVSDALAVTCPLITKADGGKFGKSESGNVWLDRRYTTPYKFYQFWFNVSDEDAKKYIRIFTDLTKEEIEALEMEHDKAPHERLLQRRLAEEITVMVHSREDYDTAVRASEILFGNATKETLSSIDEETFLSVFDGVPMAEVSKSDLDGTTGLLDLLVSKCGFFKSNGELRKLIQSGGISINKEKVSDSQYMPTADDLVEGSYMLIQKGKKNYFLVHAV
ncbi:tyrosine--tRNA ligase [Porphyromonas sp. HMSC065F10]|uniref:tyrosine--tRNA ligase n=1 Tax=Porphyromonas sp. HMSC065F10 TaxID=1739394 RepID=UPI0008A4416B|nr:tyrosine--tRNA ligase [Porphyromonas sp. HMSC065F10]OFR33043.1 tyrosine--tRNA ligase [Porphyromonas sp. HMSC065F10]